MNSSLQLENGLPYPFGAVILPNGINFSVYAKGVEEINLCLFQENSIETPYAKIPMLQTGELWHRCIKDIKEAIYCYEVKRSGTLHYALDPYAKSIHSEAKWGNPRQYHPRGKVFDSAFNWEDDKSPQIYKKDLIIYEMHVRGFTCDSSSGVQFPGTFKGIVEKIPYLLELGVNAVELMPVQEFDEMDVFHSTPEAPKKNYFGYSTVNFFSLMNRYANECAELEFKTMVKELHKNGIEVILDIVFNHTFEGNEKGLTLSYKALDPDAYYMINGENQYLNFSGCGNTFNCNHPIAKELIIQALRHWVIEYHVDGFRFDLASIFNRDGDGTPLEKAPIIEFISKDPVLSNIKLIAEAWDPGGLYQVGVFASHGFRWSDWNGKYQASVRNFIRGMPGHKGLFASALSGSNELFPQNLHSGVNYIVAHDGFTLSDLVSYNEKHNLENGENNCDGTSENNSWNCGHEGESDRKRVLHLRQKQMRNFHLALMVSQGVPMLFMGDEYAHTRKGNNNPWAQDNELNWFLWNRLEDNKDFFNYYKFLIHFRKNFPLLHNENILDIDIRWHGVNPDQPEWDRDNKFVAFTLHKKITGETGLYVAFNSFHHYQEIKLPIPCEGKGWRWVIDTTKSLPFTNEVMMTEDKHHMAPHSSILLIC